MNILLLLSISSFVLGLLIGYLLSSRSLNARIESAKGDVRAEFESEKVEISNDLNEQLAHVRNGLVETICAYQSALKVVEEKLPPPSNSVGNLDVVKEPELLIEFENAAELSNQREEDSLEQELADGANDDFELKGSEVEVESDAEDLELNEELSNLPDADENDGDKIANA